MSTKDNEIKLPLQVHCYHDTIEVVEEVKRNLHIFYLFIYLQLHVMLQHHQTIAFRDA